MTDNAPLGPPPIEPLSDAAWGRIERGLWSRMDTPLTAQPAPGASRRRWIVAAPLVAAIAATVAIVIGVRDGAVVTEPSRVVSGPAPAAVSFGDIHIELDATTALVTTREAGHPIVVLERGAAWFTVAPRQQRPDVVVRAGDATIRVVGTRFRVARAGERSEVEVEHGLVEVQFRGGVISVGAHQRWSSESPQQTQAIAAVPPPAPSPPPAREAADPASQAAPDPTPPTTPAPRPAAPAHAKPRPAQAADVADRDRAEYDRLAALEPSSPDAALVGYLALARGTGPWAAPALYAAARLAVDERDHRAKALLDSYLRRFPRGANAADARQLREHLQLPGSAAAPSDPQRR